MEPLIHFVVPFVALMLAGLEFRKALPVSLFALLPDLDALILVHRSTSHCLDAPLLTGGGVILSVVLLFPVLLKIFKVGWQQLRELTAR